jgi:hypothetical protein
MVIVVAKDWVPRDMKGFGFIDVMIGSGPEGIRCVVNAILIEVVYVKSELNK